MTTGLDEKDRAILQEVSRDSSQTTKRLARKLGLPPTTVHNRIARLEKEGVITGYSAHIDHAKAGKPLGAIINVTVNYQALKRSQHDTAKQIAEFEGVDEVAIVTGEMDIVVKLHVRDANELDEFLTKKLRTVASVDRTVSWVIIHEFEGGKETVLRR